MMFADKGKIFLIFAFENACKNTYIAELQ